MMIKPLLVVGLAVLVSACSAQGGVGGPSPTPRSSEVDGSALSPAVEQSPPAPTDTPMMSLAPASNVETLLPSPAAPNPIPDATLTPRPIPTGYKVSIEKGIQQHWTATQAAALVMGILVSTQDRYRDYAPASVLVPPRILSISAVRLRDVPEYEYGGKWNADSEHQDPNEVVWVIDAQGTFLNNMIPGELGWGTKGNWVFDDQGNDIMSGASANIVCQETSDWTCGPIGTPKAT